MLRKLAALVVAIMLGLGGAVTAAAPAQAADWHNCPYDYVCLYQWTGYGAPPGDANPGWRTTFANLLGRGCINLTSYYWPNGTKLWDNSAALIVGGSGAYDAGSSVSFYNSTNCSSATGVVSFNANWVTGVSDLHTEPIGYQGLTAYHTIASIGWNVNVPPGAAKAHRR